MKNPKNPFQVEFDRNTLRERRNQTLQHSPSDFGQSTIEINMRESPKHEYPKTKAAQARADIIKNGHQSRSTTLNEIFTEEDL